MKKNLTPGIKTSPRKLVPLRSASGAATGKELALPASIAHGEEFKLGAVRFRRTHDYVQARDPIPASWFVDLSEDVSVEHGA